MSEILSPNPKLKGVDAKYFDILSHEKIVEITKNSEFLDGEFWLEGEMCNLQNIYGVESTKKYEEVETVHLNTSVCMVSNLTINQKNLTNCWALAIASVLEASIAQLLKKRCGLEIAKQFSEKTKENVVTIADSLSLYFGREINTSAPGMHIDFVLERLANRTVFQQPLINYIQIFRNVLKENEISIEELSYKVRVINKRSLASNLNSGCTAVGTQVKRAYGISAFHAICAYQVKNKKIRFRTTMKPFKFEVPISSLEADEEEYLDTFFMFDISD